MSIGSNIKKLRLDHGLDQVQFGEIAGVTDKAVSSWKIILAFLEWVLLKN